ncbi:zinc finger BED domain-containing protein 4-like [Belonocnema kinseyi]|uniref:zinc finger BED domain-containing protein 4-like n=1 Tax=Belonocnema kinseyi TaxID=2817044 RepID=UPI00143D7BA4|nr:zinc finger BED domain-containing protein 4-like [Belonocnema kinseyi]
MNVLDQDPTILKKEGFIRLLSKCIPQYKLPDETVFPTEVISGMFKKMEKKVELVLSGINSEWISVTVSSFKCNVTTKICLLLTVYWPCTDFQLNSVLLPSIDISGTLDHLPKVMEKVNEALKIWKIHMEKVHTIFTNFSIDERKYTTEKCFLFLKESCFTEILNNCNVQDVIECTKLFTHFQTFLADRLKLIKTLENENVQSGYLRANKAIDTFMQEGSTTSLSILIILSHLIVIESGIKKWAVEDNIQYMLSTLQWELIGDVVGLTDAFEKAETKMLSSTSIISEIIPALVLIKSYIQKRKCSILGLSLQTSLLTEIGIHLDDLEKNTSFSLATVLDPRYKGHLFTKEAREDILRNLEYQLKLANNHQCGRIENEAAGGREIENFTGQSNFVPDSLESCFEEMMTGVRREEENQMYEKDEVKEELNMFFLDKLVDQKECPRDWWFKNTGHFPKLSKVAFRFLCVSTVCLKKEDLCKKNYENYEELKKILFLKYNMTQMNVKY